jgi:regulator of RNase E activity RraA
MEGFALAQWKNDLELFQLIGKELFTALAGDVMDTMGLTHQFLPPQIRPLRDDMTVLGRAMTVLEADCAGTHISSSGKDQPFGIMFEALDDIKEGEVYICNGSSPSYALWGGLMSTRAMHLKAAGAVLNGYSRDTREILRLGLPTFSWGGYAQDQGVRGRVVDFRCPLEFPNGVRVNSGDIVFGDIDGVVVIPREHEAEVVEKALEKARGENRVARSIREGMSARQAFDTYGIM